jgi:hypothetical protein
MKRLLILALFSTSAFAQQTVTGTCQITLPASSGAGLPVGMTFDGTTLTVAKLKLTSGPTLTPGVIYGLQPTDTAGDSVWTPIPAAGGTTTVSAIQFVTVTVPAAKQPIGGGGAFDFKWTPPSGHVVSVESTTNPGNWFVDHYAGAIRFRLVQAAGVSSTPAFTVTVGYE